ncbi:MAG: LacI family DNA-binding transcriptional regulator [Acholeplasma sp.]|nr:LacI family DNA-binding transcriptional regulator [Acholeplasma sp.]
MITLEVIAKKAGVSVSTVSKALNGYAVISEETRNLVTRVAEELGYTPNANAQSLVKKRANTIGVVYEVQYGLKNLFFSAVMEAFRRNVQEQGFDILLLSNNTENKLDYLKHCVSKNVDAVLIVSVGEAPYESIKKLQESDLAVIMLDPPVLGNNTVYSDSYLGIKDSCSYLYNLGHRRIAFLNGSYENFIGKERFEGYLDFMKEKELEPLYIGDVSNESYTFDEGYETMKALYKKYGIVDAICSVSDLMAMGAMAFLREKGLKVPDDVSIIGFDDLSVCELASPPLTTIAQDYENIGKKASDLILKMLETGERIVDPIIVRTSLVVRDSCKKR